MMTDRNNNALDVQEYVSPEISEIFIQAEGVLCESNEPLDEYLGDW